MKRGDTMETHEINVRPIIEAVNLTKRYEDGNLALDHVNFKVYPGQIFSMLGGNGAGKTTTINLFLNFVEPSEGEAIVDGIIAHKEPLLAKQKIAFVSENVMLYPNFSAIQNLDFFSKLGGKTNLTRDNYKRVLNRVGLQEDAHDKKLKGYSKGMRQKCGIAIAILKDAPAIFLDEPTSGLDPKAGVEFITLLEELRDEGKAILMSTHDIFRAKEISDTIGIMNNGRLVYYQPKQEFMHEDIGKLYVDFMEGYMMNTVVEKAVI